MVSNTYISITTVSYHIGMDYRSSASTCAETYNETLSVSPYETEPFPSAWKFDHKLRTEHVWDAFVLLCLIEDCCKDFVHAKECDCVCIRKLQYRVKLCVYCPSCPPRHL